MYGAGLKPEVSMRGCKEMVQVSCNPVLLMSAHMCPAQDNKVPVPLAYSALAGGYHLSVKPSTWAPV
jgi:hypothetical protein